MNIRTLIVDDEPLARRRIKRFLVEEPGFPVIGECGSGHEAVEAIQASPPDLLFLDIQMPGMDGFEVIESLGEERSPMTIFITAYDQHALKAFDVHALDYLLKPFTQDRFKKAIARVRTQMANGSHSKADHGLAALISSLRASRNYLSRFMVKTSNRVVLVKAHEVDWIESAANYALLHVGDKTHLVRETMQTLEARLNPKIFQRVSRSVIVNLERVKELQPMGKGQYVIILANGKQLAMSRGIRDLQHALEPEPN